VLAEVQRLGATHAVAVGGVPQAHLSELEAYGLTTEHTGLSSSARGDADAAATWMLGRTHGRGVMCIETGGVSADSAAAAAAVAGQLHMPLVIGVDSAVALDLPVVWLVGPEAAARAGEVSGGFPIRGASKAEVAGALATAALAAGATGVQVHLAPSGAPDVSVGLAGEGGVILFHPDGALGGANYDWIRAHQASLRGAVAGGTLGALGDGGVYDLQSALNHFDTHRLMGVSGQGLPVISQPPEERDLGRARAAGTVHPETQSYWSSRANPRRAQRP
jgi:hypothetical protein